MARGRERKVRCSKCGREVPRNKAITYWGTSVYSTETAVDEKKLFQKTKMNYCPKCAKHYHIIEKVKRQRERKRY